MAEYDEMKAELSRLQADLAQARAETDDLVAKAWDAATAGFDELRAESERLQASIDSHNEQLRAQTERAVASEDESERLQGEASLLAEALLREHAESERLRRELEDILAMTEDEDTARTARAALAKPKK